MNIVFHRQDDDIYEYLNDFNLVKIVYGINFAKCFLDENPEVKIDFFCDKRSEEIKEINNIKVINKNQISQICNNRKVVIVIAVGPNENLVNEIYDILLKLDIGADVFDYFANSKVFCDRYFEINKEKICFFENVYNVGFCNTRMTERSVEIALGKRFIKWCKGNVTEIGAVSPYYNFADDDIIDIIDPCDKHSKVNKRDSMFAYNLSGKNVMSISTVEHVGTGDYDYQENHSSVEAIEKIIAESNEYFVTAPIGYNQVLDDWVRKNIDRQDVFCIQRYCNNRWHQIKDICNIEYTKYWANGLMILTSMYK